jgi:hypothetical protein
MKKRTLLSFAAALLAMMLIVLTGCEAVGGLDINKALTNNLSYISAEGSASLTVELIPNEDLEPADDLKTILKYFQKVTIDIHDMKMQDLNTMSLKGNVRLATGGEIPFALSLTKDELAVLFEGASKPVVIDTAADLPPEMVELQREITEKSAESGKIIGEYIVGRLPNPETISVDKVTEKVNGENLQMQRIHAEIYGDELIGLIGELLKNIVNDKEELKEVIGQLYDIFAPVIKSSIESYMTEEELESNALLLQYLDNKELAVEFVFTTIMTYLEPVVAEYDTYAEMMEAELAPVLNKDNYAKFDIYVDKDLNVRKEDMELSIMPELEEPAEILGVKITLTSESWNLNGDVAADLIDTADGLNLNGDVRPVHFISTLDKNSYLYKLLVQDLKLTQKNITLYTNEEMPEEGYQRPFIESNTVFVPVRFVAEELDAEVTWDPQSKKVTIVDILTGKTVVLTAGEKSVEIDGEPFPLNQAPQVKDGRVYVPLRFVATALDCSVNWDAETQTVQITRD